MRTIQLLISILFIFSINMIAEEKIKDLTLLAKGESSSFAWSLYQAPSDDEDLDLILIIKNTGAKYIDLKGIDASYFSFISSAKKELKVWTATGFDDIPYRGIIVGHLHIQGPYSNKVTYSLSLKKKKDAFVPIKIKANDIKLKIIKKRDKTPTRSLQGTEYSP